MAGQLLQFPARGYAAGKITRSTGNWSPVDGSVNKLIGESGASVRARVRQLVRDFPYFSRAVDVLVDHVVGPGINLQSQVALKSGKLNTKACQQIEDAFKFWSDEADISGRLHFSEMQRLGKRQDLECGEFIYVRRESKDRGRYIPFCLQMFEADWLTSSGAKPANPKTSTINQGIEYDTSTGQVLALHFSDPDSFGKPVRVQSADVVHRFESLRPGQVRGISPFTPGVIVTHDLQDIMDAEIDGAKMAAKWLAFIRTPDPQMRHGIEAMTDGQLPIEDLENAIIEYLRPGEEIELASNPRPSANFPPFVRLILGMLAVSTGVPYELLSGDYQGLNYSVSRASRNDFAFSLKPVSTRHIRHFCTPAFHWMLDSCVMTGRLKLPNYFVNPYPYRRAVWHPPGMEAVDPLKEIKAHVSELAQNLRSPQEIVGRRGRDLEDVYREIKKGKDLADQYGLSTEEISTALAGNPAALDGQKGATT